MPLNVLVTGGAGFIGSYVIDELNDRGHKSISFDHAAPKYLTTIDTQARFLGDVTVRRSVFDAVSLCDGVIHLAGILGTQETIPDADMAVDTNIIGSLNVFAACAKFGVPCVYIAVGNHWMNNPYSITKTAAERFAFMYNKEFGTKIAVVRGLNAYGPKQKHKPIKKIIPTFVRAALNDEALAVYGDGTQQMDMIYVEDLAKILVSALLIDHGNYDSAFEAGTGQGYAVKYIAESIIEQVGMGRINFVPMRPGEPEHSIVVADIKTLKPLHVRSMDLLNLQAGLALTIPWYAAHKKD